MHESLGMRLAHAREPGNETSRESMQYLKGGSEYRLWGGGGGGAGGMLGAKC